MLLYNCCLAELVRFTISYAVLKILPQLRDIIGKAHSINGAGPIHSCLEFLQWVSLNLKLRYAGPSGLATTRCLFNVLWLICALIAWISIIYSWRLLCAIPAQLFGLARLSKNKLLWHCRQIGPKYDPNPELVALFSQTKNKWMP